MNAGGWVIDSPDHKRHVAWPTLEGCPATHPVVLPQLIVNVRYKAWDSGASGVTLASGPWYTAHADFWNTWDQTRLEEITTQSPPDDQPCVCAAGG